MAGTIREAFDVVVESFYQWVAAVRNPEEVAKAALAPSAERERIKNITGCWFAAFFLSLVLLLPVYQGFGLTLDNVSFHLCIVVTQYVLLFVWAWLLHRGFLIYKIRSQLHSTFVLYAVITASIGPLVTLLSIPSAHHTLLVIDRVKGQGLTFGETVKAVGQGLLLMQNPGLPGMFIVVLSPLLSVLSLTALARFVGLVARFYGADVLQVIRAVSFTLAVLAPLPLVTAVIVNLILLYVFIARAG